MTVQAIGYDDPWYDISNYCLETIAVSNRAESTLGLDMIVFSE